MEPIHHYQHPQRVCALALSADAPAVTSASGSEVRVDAPDDRGYWKTVRLARLAKPVSEHLEIKTTPFVVALVCKTSQLLRALPF